MPTDNNSPFLQQVAKHFLTEPPCAIEDLCFVFPNRRSGQFFQHYLRQELDQHDRELQSSGQAVSPHLLPRITDINDVVAQLSSTVTATDIEMIFALYAAYSAEMGESAQTFDRFIYWAQLIINDFNDIDRSMADAQEIYANISDQRNLTSNYISEEVKAKTRQLFGDNLFTAFFDTSIDADLWQGIGNSSNDDGKVKQEFISLWNKLADIYTRYHIELSDMGVCSPGAQLRQAAQADQLTALGAEQMVFVGFGVLSGAELTLFTRLSNEHKAQFCWDDSGLEQLDPNDPARQLIGGYAKRLGNIHTTSDDKRPAVQVISVPSTTGQAKVAFDVVQQLINDGDIADIDNAIDTAIVLPDENLLTPLLHSVKGVSKLNVTLGYPLRSSSIVSLMHIVARMHHQASKEKGEWTYYREDVKDVLSHPLIKTLFVNDVLQAGAQIERTNPFRIPAEWLQSGFPFSALFRPAMDSDDDADVTTAACGFMDQLLEFCDQLMTMPQFAPTPPDDERDAPVVTLQAAFLMMYIDVLNQLKRSFHNCRADLRLQRSTIFYLIDRLTAAAVIPFTGEPLHGLQIMGLLETRSLDFENVIILSMNEQVFPRKRSISSFIPNYIRRANGMSTVEQQEAIIAFNFYRLLNRSKRVTLITDSSAGGGLGSGEPSRYIDQLKMIYHYQVDYKTVDLDIGISSSVEISIESDGVAKKKFSTRNANDVKHEPRLSASSINKFIECPLAFWLHYIQGLDDDNEVSDFMDASMFGTIVHDTLDSLYKKPDGNNMFTSADIKALKDKPLDQTVKRIIKQEYLRLNERQIADDDYPIIGEAYMMIDPIKSYVRNVLDYDENLAASRGPIRFLASEETQDVSLTMDGISFNFTYKPDRIDRIGDELRIIDYKTGSDNTAFKWDGGSLDDLFCPSTSSKKRCKAVLQLFLYSYAYLQEATDSSIAVTPIIYKLNNMNESGIVCNGQQVVFKKTETETGLMKQFTTQIATTIRNMFERPYSQAAAGSPCCNYCRYRDFCRRIPQKY